MIKISKTYSLNISVVCVGIAAILTLSGCATTGTSSTFAASRLDAANVEAAAYSQGAVSSATPAAPDFLPSGRTVSAPTGFLEMCERSPIDCEHSRQIDYAAIQTMARAAIVAKVNAVFSGFDSQEGMTATITAQPAATALTSDQSLASDIPATVQSTVAPAPAYALNGDKAGLIASDIMPPSPIDAVYISGMESIADGVEGTLRWPEKSVAEGADTPRSASASAYNPEVTDATPNLEQTHLSTRAKRADDYLRIDFDKQTQSMVQAINDRVNRTLVPDTDEHIYHTADYWVAPGMAPGTRADCEDYALQKRRMLIESGIPADALSLATVKTQFGEEHAVLVLSTLQGDFVLDNLQYNIKDWHKTGYKWVSRQSALDDLSWVSLDDANNHSARKKTTVTRIAYNP